MTSKFTEILEPSEAQTYTHPHLNVSLEDILAEEGRRRSASESSSQSGSDSPKSPTDESKAKSLRRRGFTFGSKKGRRATYANLSYLHESVTSTKRQSTTARKIRHARSSAMACRALGNYEVILTSTFYTFYWLPPHMCEEPSTLGIMPWSR
ncbi:hypothetical protein BCR34DRAFT_256833 [Clohesyomyces aquaticus]|uniref:Uncharacterized protein n=1 Tax=Clohesyomyces aquaticus TaxID=1231657 RepID=A0A1Y1ZU41_9PLEO|nr:hypothetical protein BCR34DRAFT_256833 [Clohesyomyces aquaticus]